jgi:hypothetical protein
MEHNIASAIQMRVQNKRSDTNQTLKYIILKCKGKFCYKTNHFVGLESICALARRRRRWRVDATEVQ